MISVCGCMIPTGRRRIQPIFAGVIALLVALPAIAQVCKEPDGPNSGDYTYMDCDMTYRDTELRCDKKYKIKNKDGKEVELVSMFPTCPKEEMPMKQTEKKSFIKDFTPYLYSYVLDKDDKTRPYSGYIARGTTGDPTSTFAAIGNAPKGVNRQKGCVNQIELQGITSPEDRAKMIRLQLDNCANQFILHTAAYPFHKANSQMICGTKDNPYKRCSQEDMCQPLRMKEAKNEYEASDYIEAAWKKMLNDPNYRKTPGIRPLGAQTVNPSDHSGEPHLPMGLQLKNTDAAGVKMPSMNVTVSQIVSTPYEEIIDPTHPFSPRWDFRYNERDFYSPLTAGYMSEYYDDSKAVYCAGNRADSDNEDDNKEYKVDVLEFRRPTFDKGILNRIGYNTACYNDSMETEVNIMLGPPVFMIPSPAFIAMAAASYCFKVTEIPIPAVLPYYQGQTGKAKRMKCWECYKLDGKVNDKDEDQLPPCATRYDREDRKIVNTSEDGYPVFPGGLNAFKREAVCMMNPLEKKTSAAKLCADLRAPYEPLNKLKMRYHNPDGKEEDGGGEKTVVLKEGVLEGLKFNDYFYDSDTKNGHMPYPRLWDTGKSIQKSTETGQDPNDALGQFTAIVGVGREAALDEANDEASGDSGSSGGSTGGAGGGEEEKKERKDERCMYGGWGGDVSFGGVSIDTPDPVTSWTELKLYQAYTTREQNVVCLGRYEKAFKYRSPENQLLVAAGAERTGIVKTECDIDTSVTPHRTKLETCVSKEIGEEEADKEDSATPGGETDEEGKKWKSLQYIQDSWPLAWRGYLSAKDDENKFPKFPDGAGARVTGLDKAECGDILLMPDGGGEKGDSKSRGLPKLARVKCEAGEKPDERASAVRDIKGKHFVEVEEADNGKWPDVCGTTNMLGEMKTRRLFKPGEMRPEIKSTLEALDWTTSCEDTMLSECEMKTWSELKLYRPIKDVRDGNDGDEEGGDE